METCRDQHILMQTLSLSWHGRKVHPSSTSLATLPLTVPKSMFPGQSTNGKESVILSRCKLMTPSSLSSHSVMEPDWGTGKPRAFSLGSSVTDSVLSGLALFFLDEERPFPDDQEMVAYLHLPAHYVLHRSVLSEPFLQLCKFFIIIFLFLLALDGSAAL